MLLVWLPSYVFELHSKSGRGYLKTMSRMDAGMPVEMQRLLQRQLSQCLGMEQGLADILNRKLKQDSCLLAKDYSQDNYVIEFDTSRTNAAAKRRRKTF
jgi:hypothetical protein